MSQVVTDDQETVQYYQVGLHQQGSMLLKDKIMQPKRGQCNEMDNVKIRKETCRPERQKEGDTGEPPVLIFSSCASFFG